MCVNILIEKNHPLIKKNSINSIEGCFEMQVTYDVNF